MYIFIYIYIHTCIYVYMYQCDCDCSTFSLAKAVFKFHKSYDPGTVDFHGVGDGSLTGGWSQDDV